MPKRPRVDKQKLKLEAEEAFKKQETKYKEHLTSDRELKLLNDLQKKGTLSDKVSSLMLKIQKSFIPDKFCDFPSLEILMHMARKKSRHHSFAALEGLKELFFENLLPKHPLKYINDIEVNKVPGGLSKLHLEDKLKHKYSEFINILKTHTLDTVDFFKKGSIKILAELAKKEEMQEYILECIVNKLGDPNKVVPTAVILECNHLVWRNKGLMEIMVKTISRFVSKSNLSTSAKFYAIVLMNSFKLTPTDQTALQLLIQTLLRLFPTVLQETRVSGNKAVSLLLKALNKNFPLFTNKNSYQNFFKEEINEIYKLTHSGNTNIQIEALRFIYQSEQAQGFVSDRYYRSLYEFIVPLPSLRNITTKALSLLFDTLTMSLKDDSNISRVKAFVKRILQVCLISEPAFILASLMFVSNLSKSQKSLVQLLEVASEDEEELYEDMPDSDSEGVLPENKEKVQVKHSKYDPLKREPKFAGAEHSGLFELSALLAHPHPTVKKWAGTILENQEIEYQGDPLLDFTLINFLDRFEYRNPKKSLLNKLEGKKIRMSLIKDAVTSKEFRDQEDGQVREDEMFFYKYFKLRPEKVKDEAEEEEFGSVEEEDDEFADFDGLDYNDDQNLDEEDEESGAKTRKKHKKSVFMDADEFYSKES